MPFVLENGPLKSQAYTITMTLPTQRPLLQAIIQDIFFLLASLLQTPEVHAAEGVMVPLKVLAIHF